MAKSHRENYRKGDDVKEEREADIRMIEKQLKGKKYMERKRGRDNEGGNKWLFFACFLTEHYT